MGLNPNKKVIKITTCISIMAIVLILILTLSNNNGSEEVGGAKTLLS